MKKEYLGIIEVLSAGILWGIIGVFSSNLSLFGLSALDVVFVRCFGSAIILTVFLLIYNRKLLKIKLKHLPYFIGTGFISLVLFMTCYFTCQQLCSLTVAAILLYTSPAFVIIMSAIIWREKITKNKLCALVLTFTGSVLVSGYTAGDLNITLYGFIIGVLSGFFYALYSVFARLALAKYGTFTVIYYTFLIAALGSGILSKPVQIASALQQPGVLVYAVGIVLISTFIPYILYTQGLTRMENGKAAIIVSIEPITAAFVGILVFHEEFRFNVILGLLCIIVSVILIEVKYHGKSKG